MNPIILHMPVVDSFLMPVVNSDFKGPVNSQGLLFKNYRLICTDS